MNTNRQLYDNTYRSLAERIRPNGYAATSLTGAYDGMYVRDASVQILAHIAAGDRTNAAKLLRFTLISHRSWNPAYAMHVMRDEYTPLSVMPQADTAFLFLHALMSFISVFPDAPELDELLWIAKPVIPAFADYYFERFPGDEYTGSKGDPSKHAAVPGTPESDPGCFIRELGLLMNPFLEHSRDHSYYRGCDLLTNVWASQALKELSDYAASTDPAASDRWLGRSEAIAEGIRRNLTCVVDGKRIYAEMRSFGRLDADTRVYTAHEEFYPGFSWVNLAPIGAGWYAAQPDILANTYEMYMRYGSEEYFGHHRMLQAVSTLIPAESTAAGDPASLSGSDAAGTPAPHSAGDAAGTPELLSGASTVPVLDHPLSRIDEHHVIGKGLAWEIMYMKRIGNRERLKELVSFIEENTGDIYRESWRPDGEGTDTANQEHASWMVIAMHA